MPIMQEAYKCYIVPQNVAFHLVRFHKVLEKSIFPTHNWTAWEWHSRFVHAHDDLDSWVGQCPCRFCPSSHSLHPAYNCFVQSEDYFHPKDSPRILLYHASHWRLLLRWRWHYDVDQRYFWHFCNSLCKEAAVGGIKCGDKSRNKCSRCTCRGMLSYIS